MATIDPVVFKLEADLQSYNAEVANATRLSEANFRKIEKSASNAERAVGAAGAGTEQFARLNREAVAGGEVLNAMAIGLPDLTLAMGAAGSEARTLAGFFDGPWGSALATAASVAADLAPAIRDIGDAAKAEGKRQEATTRLRQHFPTLASSTALADRDRLAILTDIATATIDQPYDRRRATTAADDRLRAADELARRQEAQILSLADVYEQAFRGGTSAIWRDFKDIGLRVIAETLARFTAARLGGQQGGIGDFLGTAVSSVLGIGRIPGFAAGTDSAPRGLAWVGEKGRELVNFSGGEQVIPLHKLGGGGPSIINVTVEARDAVLTHAVRQWVAEGVQQATMLGSQLGAAQAEARMSSHGRRTLPG